MPRVEIRGEQYSIGDLFDDRFLFIVPPYQRPYAWTTEHAGELLDDLLAFLGDGKEPVDELNPYFLGSIVLIKGDRPDAQIVDGQQRLITLTILLAALRALVPRQFAQSITRRLYEPEDPLKNSPARYRLHPKDRDAIFFQDYIQKEGGIARLPGYLPARLSDSQRNMRENALLYLTQLEALPEQRRIRLAQFILWRCLLVVVSTPDLDSAYRIFSVLNDRGLDLSYSDILKAEIVGRIPQQAQHEYTVKWEDAEESLGRDAFQDLFGHIRMIYRKTRQVETVLTEFREYVIGAVPDSRRLMDDVLLPFANAYYVVENADYQQPREAERVNASLRWLNRIDNSDWIPPAIAYLARHAAQPERLVRFLADLERLAAGMMIRRQLVNKRTERYGRVLAAIEKGDDLGAASSPLQLTAGERAAIVEALDGDWYLMNARPRQYVLLRLDSTLAGTEASYNHRTITVEHVLPQNPALGSVWTRWFPTQENRDAHVHKLGNLVLLSRAKNAQAGNLEFDQKKRTYFATKSDVATFALTTQVLTYTKWTPDIVDKRQRDLVAHLKQLWRL
jgi:hypothetical protein